jgi:hypothetical protein
MVILHLQILLVQLVTSQLSYPEQGGSAITSAFNTPLEVPRFNAHIVAYFDLHCEGRVACIGFYVY